MKLTLYPSRVKLRIPEYPKVYRYRYIYKYADMYGY